MPPGGQRPPNAMPPLHITVLLATASRLQRRSLAREFDRPSPASLSHWAPQHSRKWRIAFDSRPNAYARNMPVSICTVHLWLFTTNRPAPPVRFRAKPGALPSMPLDAPRDGRPEGAGDRHRCAERCRVLPLYQTPMRRCHIGRRISASACGRAVPRARSGVSASSRSFGVRSADRKDKGQSKRSSGLNSRL